MTWAAFRTSDTFHYKRPSRRCAARIAWDILAEGGEIVSMRLLDGIWFCKRPNDDVLGDVEAAYVRQALVNNWDKTMTKRCPHTEVEVWVLGRTDDVYTVRRGMHEVVVTALRNEFSDEPAGYRFQCVACDTEWKGQEPDRASAPRWVRESFAAYKDDCGACLL